mmetsp:Transcript_58771/g.65795  ORF Transcript_58771/g.65795 Transcript_58771/m.65795 type:complete len:133 (+) Transcript_58771:18-416(+)
MIMKNTCLSVAVIVSFWLCSASAFVVPNAPVTVIQQQQHPSVALVITQDSQQQLLQVRSSPLQDGIREFLSPSSLEESATTMTLSLKDRPPPPTAEEIATKKRNFNLWFWGGGFVAPFLATFYYFGLQFWKR